MTADAGLQQDSYTGAWIATLVSNYKTKISI